MTDLMEREPIDEIAKQAVARLRGEVSLRPLPELRLRRPRKWMAPAFALVTVVAIIAGLVAIGTNRNQAVGDPNDPRWILGDLPTGWTAIAADEPQGTPGGDGSTNLWAMYTTDKGPAGPVLAIVPDDTGMGVGKVSHIRVGDRNAVIGDVFSGSRWLDIEVSPGRWRGLVSHGIDDATLVEIGGRLTLSAGGYGLLPDPAAFGLRFAGAADPLLLGPGSGRKGTARSYYRSPSGVVWQLSVGRASSVFDGFVGLEGAGSVPGTGVYLAGDRPEAYWARGGVAFTFSTLDATGVLSDGELVRLAQRARRAGDDEWLRLTRGTGPQTAPVGTRSVAADAAAPVGTEAPLAEGNWIDVHVETTVTKLDEFTYQLSFALPEGQAATMKVELAGRSVRCDGGATISRVGGGQASPDGSVCSVYSPPAPVPTMYRIYGNDGVRYILDPQVIDGVTIINYRSLASDTPRGDVVLSDGSVYPLF
jgi:hypothetical protein